MLKLSDLSKVTSITLQLVCALLVCTSVSVLCRSAAADNIEASPNLSAVTNTSSDRADNTRQNDQFEQLVYIQSVLSRKLNERRNVGNRISNANEQDKADLRREASTLTSEIAQLRETLESIATGGIDRKLFAPKTKDEKKDWREDVSLIAQPVLDSLKEITEKPRRIKDLNELVELKQQELTVSTNALENLATTTNLAEDHPLSKSIANLERKWQKRLDDAQSQIDIAKIQLNNIDGDRPLSQSIYSALLDFIKGRGLTIAMAIAAAWLVLVFVKLLMKVYQHLLLDKRRATSRTRYRVAKYSVQALTFTLILMAVFVVFYERHDVLLLGLLILLIVGFVLNAKQLLPRYLREARLLLNLGAMREGERIVYNGLPYRVESINMYTVFKNPELDGILRLPLAELTKTCSRPVQNDSWFPSSKGDVVLTADHTLLRVLEQNPDTVELMKRGGEHISIRSSDFYAMSMSNLTHLGTYGVTVTFGIDYDLQSISATKVPTALHRKITSVFGQSNLSDYLKEVRVELAEAGSSSINYWIFVTMDSQSAFSYYRVQRMVHSACIETCTENNWPIPFPHMSVVQKGRSSNDPSQTTPFSKAS